MAVNKVAKKDLIWAVRSALERAEWLKYKWEGSYGNRYDKDTKEYRIKEERMNMVKLRGIKQQIKEGH